MADYIEREAAVKELMNDAPEQVGYSREDAADCIRYMPAADVATVVHGRWIYFGGKHYTRISQCTNCCAKYDFQSNYCPNCGARMDLEETHE